MPEMFNTSHEHRGIFIHVPKAAGTSIKKVLNMPGAGHVAWVHYAFCYREIWQQYTSFAVVRNPWDRVVSAYHFAKMKQSHWHTAQLGPPLDYELLSARSFEDCLTILYRERERLKGEAWVEQTHWVACPLSLGGTVMVDRVLRAESLDTEFPRLCADLGVDLTTLPRLNRSDRSGDYRQYYNRRSRKLVELVYASDIETFGYSF